MKRLDLSEPKSRVAHAKRSLWNEFGRRKWGTWGVEKSWLMVGNKCDWLYDEVNLLFPSHSTQPPFFILKPPPLTSPPLWMFEGFFPKNTPFHRRMCDYLHSLHSKSNAVHHVQLTKQSRDAQLCIFLLAEISVSPLMICIPRISFKRLSQKSLKKKNWILKWKLHI